MRTICFTITLALSLAAPAYADPLDVISGVLGVAGAAVDSAVDQQAQASLDAMSKRTGILPIRQGVYSTNNAGCDFSQGASHWSPGRVQSAFGVCSLRLGRGDKTHGWPYVLSCGSSRAQHKTHRGMIYVFDQYSFAMRSADATTEHHWCHF